MNNSMRTLKSLIFPVLFAILPFAGYSQCQPYIMVDGSPVIANSVNEAGLTLPLWLRAGQTLAADQMVYSISVLEFTENGTSLEYSQVIKVTTVLTVPAGKVWKVESILKKPSFSTAGGVTYSQTGTYTFTVPACANQICIEVWGAGGGGGYAGCYKAGGGGGGGYGQDCFTVTPGATYTVTVGAGGASGATGTWSSPCYQGLAGSAGGNSSVGSLISANGGAGGGGSNGTGGAGGSSTANINISGGNGMAVNCASRGGMGGNGGLGGAAGCGNGGSGIAPGGGGAGGGTNQNSSGGVGADGKVVITW
jgi:hypothetical protein